MSTRSGFIALAGRPNVGKSTLVNAIVGRKVAIVSEKPQTTRRAIRGVSTVDDTQLVLVDLPGVQRPRDELTRRMQSRVESELAQQRGAVARVFAGDGIDQAEHVDGAQRQIGQVADRRGHDVQGACGILLATGRAGGGLLHQRGIESGH